MIDQQIATEIKRDFLVHVMTSMPQMRQEVEDILENEIEVI